MSLYRYRVDQNHFDKHPDRGWPSILVYTRLRTSLSDLYDRWRTAKSGHETSHVVKDWHQLLHDTDVTDSKKLDLIFKKAMASFESNTKFKNTSITGSEELKLFKLFLKTNLPDNLSLISSSTSIALPEHTEHSIC